MKKYSQRYWFALLFAGMLLAGCKKLDLVPTNKFTDETFWTTPEKASTVLSKAYSQMYDPGWFFYNDGMSDNAYNGRGDQYGVNSIAAGLADASLGRFKDEWNAHYACIKTCNIFLENIDRVPGMDENLRNRMKGEARFIRAYQFFQLYTWYGDVPLFDHDLSVEEAKSVTRSPRASVVDFVLSELDASTAILPLNTEIATADRGRVSKGAAQALKARVLLYESRWPEVVATLEPLVNGSSLGTYSLFNSYEGLFLPANEYNSEVIFDLQMVPETRTQNFYFDMAPVVVGARLNALAPTQELVNDYIMLNGKAIGESGSGYNEDDPYTDRDPRFYQTIVYNGGTWKKPDGSLQEINTSPGSAPDGYAPGGTSSPTAYYFRKYYDPSSINNFNSGLNLILIRYADVLLMYAEAKNELNQLDATVWDQTIGALRRRAGFTQATAINFDAGLNQAGLQAIIRRERRTELALEGLRIFDIRRWRIAEQVMNGWAHGARFGEPTIDNGYIQANQRSFDAGKHYLWAIPRDERNLNTQLSQNAGW